jgi:hypothetical protein
MNIIQKARAGSVALGAWKQLEKLGEKHMQKRQMAYAALLIVIKMLTDLSPLVDETTKHYITTALVVVGAVKMILNLFQNPDGTDAEKAWRPDGPGKPQDPPRS